MTLHYKQKNTTLYCKYLRNEIVSLSAGTLELQFNISITNATVRNNGTTVRVV